MFLFTFFNRTKLEARGSQKLEIKGIAEEGTRGNPNPSPETWLDPRHVGAEHAASGEHAGARASEGQENAALAKIITGKRKTQM